MKQQSNSPKTKERTEYSSFIIHEMTDSSRNMLLKLINLYKI